ncbi:MAG TPA: hypothetical protein VK547_09595 [Candidatus Udaeobacter sp.]|nr:hypothetical protein [Candidatus Udaeobacter sp.]
MTAAVKAAALCAGCTARRDAADGATREHHIRTTPNCPDVPAPREHHIRITVWTTCSSCPGGTR